jgi:hypothetical protein
VTYIILIYLFRYINLFEAELVHLDIDGLPGGVEGGAAGKAVIRRRLIRLVIHFPTRQTLGFHCGKLTLR